MVYCLLRVYCFLRRRPSDGSITRAPTCISLVFFPMTCLFVSRCAHKSEFCETPAAMLIRLIKSPREAHIAAQSPVKPQARLQLHHSGKFLDCRHLHNVKYSKKASKHVIDSECLWRMFILSSVWCHLRHHLVHRVTLNKRAMCSVANTLGELL